MSSVSSHLAASPRPGPCGDVAGLVAAVERKRVGLTVVGPEAPLVAGLVDALAEAARAAFGPSAAAARLEGSKAWSAQAAVTVVLASAGYPASSSAGDPIDGLEALPESVEVAHAGTARRDGRIVTAGGRVLAVTALGAQQAAARAAAYAAARRISFDGVQMRSDIAAEPIEAGASSTTRETPDQPAG